MSTCATCNESWCTNHCFKECECESEVHAAFGNKRRVIVSSAITKVPDSVMTMTMNFLDDDSLHSCRMTSRWLHKLAVPLCAKREEEEELERQDWCGCMAAIAKCRTAARAECLAADPDASEWEIDEAVSSAQDRFERTIREIDEEMGEMYDKLVAKFGDCEVYLLKMRMERFLLQLSLSEYTDPSSST